MTRSGTIHFALAVLAGVCHLGLAGSGLRFDRNTNDRVSIPESQSLDINGQGLTIEAWVRLPNPSLHGEMTFLNKENSYEAKVGNGLFQVAVWTDSWAWLGANTQVQANQWTHLAATYDGQNVRLYVNGELRSTHAKQGNLHTSDSLLFFGTRPFNGFIYSYNGDLDEVRLWNVARTQQELRANMNFFMAGNERGLVGYWRMDEGQGQIVRDRTPNHNDGFLGARNDADNADPDWFESDAPLRGGEMAWSGDRVEMGPTPEGQDRERVLFLANTSHEDDERFAVDYTLTDQGGDPDWLEIDPEEGTIDPGDTVAVTMTAVTEGLELGEYERLVQLECNAANIRELEIGIHIFVVEGFGRLYGQVTDGATGDPIAGAEVRVDVFGFADTSDGEGNYEFAGIPSWTYDLVAAMPDYLPLWAREVEVGADEEVELDFALLHAEFASNPARFQEFMEPDQARELPLWLLTQGNGPLTWGLDLAFPEGVEVPSWELRRSFPVSQSVGDDRLEGVVFAEGRYYVSGANGEDPNLIYVLDRDGAYVDSFRQQGTSVWGMKDMAWDGAHLWGSGEGRIYCFTTGGDSVTSIAGVHRTTQALAWDPDRGVLWTSDITSDIVGLTVEGQQRGSLDRMGMRIYGLGYWPDDPDGHQLYIFHDRDGQEVVTKMDAEDGDTLSVRLLVPEGGGRAGGCEITNQIDPYSWVFLTVANVTGGEAGDRVDLWQLEANTGWVSVDTDSGVVAAGGEQELTVTLNSADLLAAVYSVDLAFSHDGVGGCDTIPLTLDVGENLPQPPSGFDLLSPADGSVLDLALPPAENLVTFSWAASVDPNPEDTVVYEVHFGQYEYMGGSLVDSVYYVVADASLTADLFALIADSLGGFDHSEERLEWWVRAVSPPDSVESDTRFNLTARRPESASAAFGEPVGFGLGETSPNPFNSRVALSYGLERAAEVRLTVYDAMGREAAILASGQRGAGNYRLTWDASDLSSGIYIVKLASGGRVQSRKVVLVR